MTPLALSNGNSNSCSNNSNNKLRWQPKMMCLGSFGTAVVVACRQMMRGRRTRGGTMWWAPRLICWLMSNKSWCRVSAVQLVVLVVVVRLQVPPVSSMDDMGTGIRRQKGLLE